MRTPCPLLSSYIPTSTPASGFKRSLVTTPRGSKSSTTKCCINRTRMTQRSRGVGFSNMCSKRRHFPSLTSALWAALAAFSIFFFLLLSNTRDINALMMRPVNGNTSLPDKWRELADFAKSKQIKRSLCYF